MQREFDEQQLKPLTSYNWKTIKHKIYCDTVCYFSTVGQ